MAGKVGFKGELSLGAGPTVIGRARDAELTADAGTVDITARDSAGWKEFLQGLKEYGISAGAIWVPDNTGLELIISSYISGSPIAHKFLDEASGQGFSGSVIITKVGLQQPFEGGISMQVEMKGTGALVPEDPA